MSCDNIFSNIELYVSGNSTIDACHHGCAQTSFVLAVQAVRIRSAAFFGSRKNGSCAAYIAIVAVYMGFILFTVNMISPLS